MTNLIAQSSIPLAPPGGFKGFGSLGLENIEASQADIVFTKFLSSTIGLMSIIAVIWFIFLLITGSYGYMTAGGDKAKIEKAQKTIINGVVGLAITVFAIFIVKFIGSLLGIDFILNITSMLGVITGNIVH